MNKETSKTLLVVYGKQDIMKMFNCESRKALKILKTMYEMKMATKIGKYYYVNQEQLTQFMEEFKGQEVLI